MQEVRQRLLAVLLGSYAPALAYKIPVDHFHYRPDDSTLEELSISGAERAVEIELLGTYLLAVPLDRMSGYSYPIYDLKVRVCYQLTRSGDGSEHMGQQSGSGTFEAVQDRAVNDRRRIEAALSDYLNTGGITPNHIIDCVPFGELGAVQLSDRTIFTIPLRLSIRCPLAVATNS